MTVIINGTTGVTSVNGSAAAPSVTGTDTDTGIVYGTNTLSLATGGTTAMTIDSSGFLNLVQTQSKIFGGGSTSGRLVLSNSDGTTYMIVYGAAYGGSSSSTISMVTNTSYVTTLNGSGNLVLNGGTATANGTGITFPATQSASSDANCLDDYEEGTWTPTWSVSGGTISVLGGGTYTPAGTYTKIGNTVYIRGYISYGGSVTGTPSGALAVAGLPFTPGTGFGQSQTFAGGVTVLSAGLWLSNVPQFAQIVPGSTTTNSIGYRTSAGSAASTYADMDKNTNYSQFVFQGQYTI